MASRCARSTATVLMLGMAIVIAVGPCPAHAGPGEAGRGRRTAGTAGPDLAGADYVVLVWYRGDDALGTFQHQTYDVRKGEYTAAVDDWLKEMREKHPRYVVRLLPVDLDRERGATEQLKVGSVIHRELLFAAARSGVVLGAPIRIGPGPYASQRPVPRMNVWTEQPGAGGSSNINPVGAPMPFPMPYVRPGRP
jgi:hypothetical protein